MDPTTKRIIISNNVKFNNEKETSNDFKYVLHNIDENELEAENQFQDSLQITVPTYEKADDTKEESVIKSSREKKHPIRYPETEIYEAMVTQENTLHFDNTSTLPHNVQQKKNEAMEPREKIECKI